MIYLNDDDYLAACLYELRKAESALAREPQSEWRIENHRAALKAVDEAREIISARKATK